MYPELFGFLDSYSVMMVVGIIAALLGLFFFIKRKQYGRNQIIDILICGIVAIAFGLVFAILFQNLYDLIYYGSNYRWTWAMTFYGGAFGGTGGFVLMYTFYYKKNNSPAMKDILTIAPGCISLAHGFGRIGCFLAGCCFGKVTTSWIGIVLPESDFGLKRIPVQLIEAIFLFILSTVLLVLAFKGLFNQTFPIYMISYGVFRFIIEFFRDDYRGKIVLGMAPSQIWCVVLLLAAPAYWILTNKYIFKEVQHE